MSLFCYVSHSQILLGSRILSDRICSWNNEGLDEPANHRLNFCVHVNLFFIRALPCVSIQFYICGCGLKFYTSNKPSSSADEAGPGATPLVNILLSWVSNEKLVCALDLDSALLEENTNIQGWGRNPESVHYCLCLKSQPALPDKSSDQGHFPDSKAYVCVQQN